MVGTMLGNARWRGGGIMEAQRGGSVVGMASMLMELHRSGYCE